LTAKPIDVVCIGNAIVDVLSHVDESFLTEHGMVKGSMQLIDDDLARELYGAMPPAIEASGGSAANTAAGIASFGGRAAFIGKVADDPLGEVFTHDIRATGVRYEPVKAVAEGPDTARCMILVTSDAQRTMNTYLGVSSLIGPDDVDVELIGQAQVTYSEGYLWDLPDAKKALVKGMEAAGASGAKVAFSLSDSFCVDRHRDEFRALAEQHVDILFGNEAEICSLYETESFDDAAARVAGHCELACLTRSELGSVIITSAGEQIPVKAAPARVVDTTGAGDLYAAGFLYGYTNGLDLARSGELASLAAAEVISHLGARPEISLATLLG
jgi:sugar/nucleoside kinase (ribokinase family)